MPPLQKLRQGCKEAPILRAGPRSRARRGIALFRVPQARQRNPPDKTIHDAQEEALVEVYQVSRYIIVRVVMVQHPLP